MTIYVKGASDNLKGVASQIAAQQYISQLAKERDKALEITRSYRNHVDELQAKNRRLHCEMNDQVDVIRNFRRNNIAEGSTRAGRCAIRITSKK